MSIAEETLMAYVDGELDSPARAEIEAAMRDDPEVAERIAKHRELRAKIQSAYEPELTEAVPERLLAAVRKSIRAPDSNIVDLKEARAAAQAPPRVQPRKPTWRFAASMAASLVIGVGVGLFAWRHSDSIMIQNSGGALVASGALDRGLSNQLAGDRSPASTVDIGLSFLAKSGDYCRTFTILGGASSAGLACRHEKRWEIRALAQPGSTGGSSEYRTASSSLSPAIVSAVEQQISGEPLERSAEIAALKRQWQPAAR
jgi:anti-sigma factor RsiW